MRTITNDHDLPLPMYNALVSDDYVSVGDISSTRLIAPPRIVTLRKFHEDEIVEDASERIWTLVGRAIHHVLAQSAGDGVVVEMRLGMPITFISFEGEEEVWHVTGQPDVYYQNVLYDYKFTSLDSRSYEKPEWDRQINIQAALHRNNGDVVEKGYIVPIWKDWKKRKVLWEKEYPPAAVDKLSMPIWTPEECIDYIKRRVKLHHKAQVQYGQTKDENVLPMCSDQERWYRGHCYAVKFQDKAGKVNKNAKRKFDSKTDAIAYMQENTTSVPKGKTWAPIEERLGVNVRCESFCDVWKFCSFGRKVHAMNEERDKEKKIVNETDEEGRSGDPDDYLNS